MAEIRTRQLRWFGDRYLGRMRVDATFIDSPASLETWIAHIPALAAEFGLSALEAHEALFAMLPEIFGR